jgi:hypothetical protein
VDEAVRAKDAPAIDSTVTLKVGEAASRFFDNYLQSSDVPWRDSWLAGQVHGAFSNHCVRPEVSESA